MHKQQEKVILQLTFIPGLALTGFRKLCPEASLSKVPRSIRIWKAAAKFRTLWLQRCFIHVLVIWKEVPFAQDVSALYTAPFWDTDELKMALRAEKFPGLLRNGPLVCKFQKVIIQERFITCNNSFYDRYNHQCLLHSWTHKTVIFFLFSRSSIHFQAKSHEALLSFCSGQTQYEYIQASTYSNYCSVKFCRLLMFRVVNN